MVLTLPRPAGEGGVFTTRFALSWQAAGTKECSGNLQLSQAGIRPCLFFEPAASPHSCVCLLPAMHMCMCEDSITCNTCHRSSWRWVLWPVLGRLETRAIAGAYEATGVMHVQLALASCRRWHGPVDAVIWSLVAQLRSMRPSADQKC